MNQENTKTRRSNSASCAAAVAATSAWPLRPMMTACWH